MSLISMVEVRRSKEEEEEEDKNVSQQPGGSHTAALYTIEQAGVAFGRMLLNPTLFQSVTRYV